MVHKVYSEELEKRLKRVKWYYLGLFSAISVAIILLLIVIRSETHFFVEVQETRVSLTAEERTEIENRLLAGWAKRDLGFNERREIEIKVLGADVEAKVLSPEERKKIEERLK